MAVLRLSEFQAINRNDPLELAFSSIIEDTMNLISKVMLPLFFTPVVAITNLFTKNGWLILVNCTIALGNIASTIFGCFEGTITFFDFLISLGVMGGCVFVAISATPNFFPLIYNFTNVFFALNIASIAINASVLLKDLVIFAVKQIVEFFGIQLTDVFQIKPLDIENNRPLLSFLMLKLLDHDIEVIEKEQIDKDITLFNNMLKIMGQYIDQYNFSFLGSVINKRKIDNVKKLITAFYLGGNVNNVIQFIELELECKITEIRNLDKAEKELDLAVSRGDVRQYNRLLCKYFTEATEVNNIDLLQASFGNYCSLFTNQIELQLKKCYQFRDALPDSSKFKKPFKSFSESIESKYKIKP